MVVSGCGTLAAIASRLIMPMMVHFSITNYHHINTSIFTGSLLFQTELPEVVNPINIQVTRNKVFIHHELGVARYDLPCMLSFF